MVYSTFFNIFSTINYILYGILGKVIIYRDKQQQLQDFGKYLSFAGISLIFNNVKTLDLFFFEIVILWDSPFYKALQGSYIIVKRGHTPTHTYLSCLYFRGLVCPHIYK